MNSVVELKQEALRIAHRLRLGHEVQAQLDVVALAERLLGFASAERAADLASWADWIGRVMACQEAQDWLGLADYLEYELLELFDRELP